MSEVEIGKAGPRPASLGEVFLAFTRMALQGFGGVLPIAHRELVERLRWLDAAQFVEVLALSQVLPGPNVVNLAIILGDRWFGWRGSLAAAGGLLAFPFIIVMALGIAFRQFGGHPLALGALRGLGVVAAGLVISTALKLARTLKEIPLGLLVGAPLALATAVLVGLLHLPLLWVLLGLGAFSVGATALARRRREGR